MAFSCIISGVIIENSLLLQKSEAYAVGQNACITPDIIESSFRLRRGNEKIGTMAVWCQGQRGQWFRGLEVDREQWLLEYFALAGHLAHSYGLKAKNLNVSIMKVVTGFAALMLVCLFTPSLALEGGTRDRPLFIIERSKNANVVRYDIRLTAEGTPDPGKPIIAYWIRMAEDGRKRPLKWIEKQLAYGFEARYDSQQDVIFMEMVADTQRSIRVYRHEGLYRAETRIGGRPAFIRKIYVKSTETGLMPRVDYIDFYGIDVKTGAPRYERHVPH
jgi:hypothetical protein